MQTVVTNDPQHKFPYIKAEKKYNIQSKSSSLFLDITGASLNPLSTVQIFPYHGKGNQTFMIKSPNDIIAQQGHVVIQCFHSKFVLDIEGQSKENGANVIQNEYNGGDSQLWRMIQQEDGDSFIIENKGSGLVLDIRGNQKKTQTQVQQFQRHGRENQVFQLKKK